MAVGVTPALILPVVVLSELNPDTVFLAQSLVAVPAVVFLHGVSLVLVEGADVDVIPANTTHRAAAVVRPDYRVLTPYRKLVVHVPVFLSRGP